MHTRPAMSTRTVITIRGIPRVGRSRKRSVRVLVTPLSVILLMLSFAHTIGERRVTQESAVIQKIKIIHTAQVSYYSQYGRYAGSLDDLRTLLSDSDLASGVKDGYRFRLERSKTSYEIRAEPLTSISSSFYSDQTMVLRWSPAPIPATLASEPFR